MAMRLLILLAISMVLTGIEAKYIVAPWYTYRGPPAPLSSDGRVIDTPEVEEARKSHMAAHAEALARIVKANAAESKYQTSNENGRIPIYERPMMKQMIPKTRAPAIHGRNYPQSAAPLSTDGRVMDTPEVAEMKAAHLAAHARAVTKAAAPYEEVDIYDESSNLIYLSPIRVAYTQISPIGGYRGPPAPLGPDGRVIDTPEVASARAAHMKAHAHALALTTHREVNYY